MSFPVFSYNATVLLIQPNPTHGWTQPISISGAACTVVNRTSSRRCECVDKPLSFSDEELDELAVLYDRSGQTAVLRGRPHQCRREHDRQVASSHLIHDALRRHSACVPVAHATRRSIQ